MTPSTRSEYKVLSDENDAIPHEGYRRRSTTESSRYDGPSGWKPANSTEIESFPSDLPQRNMKRRFRPPTIVTEWWTIEILASILSIACTLAIIEILSWANNKLLSAWHSFFQPNTVISILATIVKTSILLPVAECISQQKWIYYRSHQPRQLSKLETFDKASRGPLGAVQLLISVRTVAVALGALVTLASLGMDPFVQQIISFKQGQIEVPQAHATLNSNRIWDTGETDPGEEKEKTFLSVTRYPLDGTLDLASQSAFYAGLYNNPVKPVVQCTAPACSWPGFTSLGICSTCNEVTASTKTECTGAANLTCTYTTPGSFQLNATSYRQWDNVTGELLASDMQLFGTALRTIDSTESHGPMIADLALLTIKDWEGQSQMGTPRTYESTFSFCAYSAAGANMFNTTYTEQESKVWNFVDTSNLKVALPTSGQFEDMIVLHPIAGAEDFEHGDFMVNHNDWRRSLDFFANTVSSQ